MMVVLINSAVYWEEELEICPLVLSVQRQGTGFCVQFTPEVRVLG
jgi:hypothetical protein